MPIPDFQNLTLPMLQLAADGADHRLSDAIEALVRWLKLSAAVSQHIDCSHTRVEQLTYTKLA